MPKARERDGVFQRKDRGGWWISYIDASGQRRKEKVVAHTRTQALKVLSAVKTRTERDKVLGVKAASEITTTELLARFKRHQKTRLRSTTFERLEGILKTLKANLPELAKEITRKTVADFISKRAETVSAGTIQKEVTTLKHALKLAVEWELLQRNVAQGAKMPKAPEGRTRYLSPSELKTALEAAPEWMRLPLALAAFTGMRRGELLSLRWTDVDLENRRLYLRETKNGSLRVLPLNELAFRLLANLPQSTPGDLVLDGLDGQKLSVYTRRLFQGLGIQDASFHSLRHTAASWLVMGGVDLYAVGQLLGHRTPRMTQRYAHLSPSYMAGAVGKLDTVFEGVMPERAVDSSTFVPVESPQLVGVTAVMSKLLN
ncbi:tyrosine-type recombinase/integrase [Acidipila rosea]|uniref:Site-specific recombinase XerD n=1 Tax=Acidipila rosea TaxID=768535 RepID=A0A4R1LBM7_9BACT|nr:site-specific integrase [Acidipila rosea]TCK75878.1 site-specific recombinase XerD [Acidipila rosea]